MPDMLKRFRFIRRAPDRIEFRIVAGHGFGDGDKEVLLREFQRRAGVDMKITFTIVDVLQRSSSGKLKAVISDISGNDMH